MKKVFVFVLFIAFAASGFAQISAKLMRQMDVSDTHIAFVFAGDIWLVGRDGGQAVQLTRSPGEESWPKFSPDGSRIAFSANYNGSTDIYVMPVTGGIPTRVTYRSFADRMVDWHPDGKRILFASAGDTGRGPNQFYLVSAEGGLPERLPVPYGELASFSPDGNKLAYITRITENYPFKRYRGGLTSDIIVFDLVNMSAENITNRRSIDGKPAWSGNTIYFLSDQAENMRINLWAYDTRTKTERQLTNFDDFDISYMSAGKDRLVFEMGGMLHVMDLATNQYKPVDVYVVSDLAPEMARNVNVGSRISNMSPSPDGKRVIFEARGELFNVPVSDGFTLNLTRSSGAFDQSPAWSHDGKHIAFWSDMSGEYEIYLLESEGSKPPRKLTSRGSGFGYALYWSPDNKKIAFIDEKNDISVLDVETGKLQVAGNTYWNVGHGSKFGYPISWSPDSKWIAFTIGLENAQEAIFVYHVSEGKLHQVSSGFYNDGNPVFSPDGKYLYYFTQRNFSAVYSALGDGTWVYPNATQLAALSLTPTVSSLLAPKNDVVSVAAASTSTETASSNSGRRDSKPEEKKEEGVKVEIDFTDIESRLVILPPKPGNLGRLSAIDGKIIYVRFPNSGSGESAASLVFYDIKEREEKTIMAEVNNYKLTSDGKSILVGSSNRFGIIKPDPGQKVDKPISTANMSMQLIPREEWTQVFNDTWRRYRDFFYDPDMHQVDWDGLRQRYGALLADARTRWDVTNLQSNLIAELSAGHTYSSGGDTESVTPQQTGFLGIDWGLDGKGFFIKNIVRPAAWSAETRSPFDLPGVDVKAGDYILTVNGVALDTTKDPYAAFSGLSGKTAVLSVSRSGKPEDAKNLVVECLSPGAENNLRYLAWIERNRQMVDELSGGRLGYIYMSNTSGRGQLELVSMFYGQLHKEGFIIDERFNGGGQLADRFLELLTRPVVYNLHWRAGRDHTNPIKTNTGPMGMLINGWAGSGGDGLPWAFKVLEAGPIVGERTLGILIGPATGHSLIDGGGITVPDARLYDNAGHWFWEGSGVEPDIEVWDDPNLLIKGRDPQMERVVEEVMKLLEANPPRMTPAPPHEDRTAPGLQRIY
jgi:tricorn protease